MAEHPYAAFPGTDAENFIQWKGTSLCMDVHCPCGFDGHVDDDFCYYVRCAGCGTVYELGTQVCLRKVDKDADAVGAKDLVNY